MRSNLQPIENLSLTEIAPEEKGIPEYTVTLVPGSYINTVWKDAEPLLIGGVGKSRERWSIEALYHSLANEHQQLWVAINSGNEIVSVVTTEFINYPTKMSLAVQFAGGLEGQTNTSIFTCVLDKLERYAADTGCNCVEFWGRKGFASWMKKAGYEETAVFYEKDINHGR